MTSGGSFVLSTVRGPCRVDEGPSGSAANRERRGEGFNPSRAGTCDSAVVWLGQCLRRAVMVTVAHQEVEILAIGAGPANLALAVAVEELAPADIASNTLIVERCESVAWQRGMLLPWAKSQVSFLKDLVTRRNPQSRFTFVNYLHSVGRLDDFIN